MSGWVSVSLTLRCVVFGIFVCDEACGLFLVVYDTLHFDRLDNFGCGHLFSVQFSSSSVVFAWTARICLCVEWLVGISSTSRVVGTASWIGPASNCKLPSRPVCSFLMVHRYGLVGRGRASGFRIDTTASIITGIVYKI